MRGEYGIIARGKIKDLRTAFQQGKLESEFFLHDRQIRELLYHGFEARYRTEEARIAQYRKQLKDGGDLEKNAFVKTGDTERCLFFDAIELIDHCRFFKKLYSQNKKTTQIAIASCNSFFDDVRW